MPEPRSVGRVLVTGAGGFIGGALLDALAGTGAEVLALSRSPVSRAGVRTAVTDLLDHDAAVDTVAEMRPATVFHLAGTTGRGGAGSPAVACGRVNVGGTLAVLEAARRCGAGRVVLLGSAEEYGAAARTPISEDAPLEPVSPYGISKAAATRLAQWMHAAEGLPVTILRPFTVYGPGQPAGMFLADAIAAAIAETPFEMTKGSQRRDYVYVGDVVEALITAAEAPGIEGLAINIGSGEAHSLREIAERVWELTGSAAPLRIGARHAAVPELIDTEAEISRAQRLLGWEPRVSLNIGLRSMVDWFRERPCRAA